MNIDKGQYFDDLRALQALLPQQYSRAFGQMIVNYYLYLIKSSHTQKGAQRGLKQQVAAILQEFKRKQSLKKALPETDLLVWVAESNHLPQALPVTSLLKEKNYRVTYISNKPKLLANPALNGYNKIQVVLPKRKPIAQKQVAEFDKVIASILSKAKFSVITTEDIPTISKVFKANVAYTNQLQADYEKLISKLNPKAALIGYDIPTEGRTLTDVLNAKDVPTFMIQHGAMAKVDGVFGTHLANTILVFGEVSKQVLKDSGSVSDIKITGAPYLDELLKKLQIAGSRAQGKLKVLVAFSGPGHLTTEEHHKKSIAAVVQVAKKCVESVEFYFKLHPKDNRSYYINEINGETLSNVYFTLPHTQSNDIFDWALFADILLTGASTVAIEAMLCRKPVISLDFTGDYKELSFVKEGAVKLITDAKELEKVIEEAAQQNFDAFDSSCYKAEQYVKQFYGPADGQAAQRCAQWVELSLNEQNT